MDQLLLKMAQQAEKDNSLLASLVKRYAAREALSWEEIAAQLRIEPGQLARLALCRRPRTETFTQDLAQIAGHVGVDTLALTRFLHRAENVPLQSKIKQRPAFRKATAFMFGRPAWALGLAALIIFFLGTLVFAQPAGAEATLVVSEGQAVISQSRRMLLSRQVETAVAAGEIVTVHKGDVIRLGASSTAQMRLQDGSTVELFEGTTLAISELVTDEDAYQVQLQMFAGKTVNRVVRLLRAGDGFEVRTPSSTASVRGTLFTVEVITPETTYVAVDEGIVHVELDDQEVDVKAGHEVTATVGQPLEVKPQGNAQPAGSTEPAQNNPSGDRSPGGMPDESPANPAGDVPGNLPKGSSESSGSPAGGAPGNSPSDVPGSPPSGASPDEVPGNPPGDVPGNPPPGGGDPPGSPPDEVPGNPPDGVPGNPPPGGGDPPGSPPDEVPGNPPDDVPGNPPAGGGDPPGGPPDEVPGNSPPGDDPPGGPPDQVPGNPPDDVPGNPPPGGGDPPGEPPDQVPGNPPDDVPGNPPEGGGDPPGNSNGNGNGNGGGP